MTKKVTRFVICGLLILTASIIFTSFSKSPVTIKGTVVCYGNEPFTYPGITTTKGKKYLVVSSDATKEELLKRQGKLIKFTGYIDKDTTKPNSLEDGSFKIETWEVIVKASK